MQDAIPWKPIFGHHAYTVCMLKKILIGGGYQPEDYFLSVDGNEIKNIDGKDHTVATQVTIWPHNKIVNYWCNFPGSMNDGLMEV
jgi:hypothetical protein